MSRVQTTSTTWTCDSCGAVEVINQNMKLTVPHKWGCIAILIDSPVAVSIDKFDGQHQLCEHCMGVLLGGQDLVDLSALAQRAGLVTDGEFINWRKRLRDSCTEPDGSCSSCGVPAGAAGHKVGCGVHR